MAGFCGNLPFVTGAPFPPRAGNHVAPLIGAIETFRRIGAAIAAARQSVWLTVTFFRPDFRWPDTDLSILDVLDRTASRGLDVRVIFWRPNPEAEGAFAGTAEERDMLAARGARFRARWDRASGRFCQHQKLWLIDAGQEGETGFVGGVNPTFPAIPGPGRRHDLYVEIAGPAATDIHHNFVQRWNGASERTQLDGRWNDDGVERLTFPTRLSVSRGGIPVQVQRQIPLGRYADRTASIDGPSHDLAAGERTILDQYKQVIDAAKRTILIENQALPVPEIAAHLQAALRRGVRVIFLLPAAPEPYVGRMRRDPAQRDFFAAVEALAAEPGFRLVGLSGADGIPVYVHAKIMLIDDEWATIGSCNLHSGSLYGHAELNASFHDAEMVRALRCRLLALHLAVDTAELDDCAALALYAEMADADARHSPRRGAFTLSATEYGV